MVSGFRAFLIFSLFITGLCCPMLGASAAAADDCGHGPSAQTEFSVPTEVMPCCLVGFQIESPGVFFEQQALPALPDQSVFASGNAWRKLGPVGYGGWEKYRDKFEERNCGKRE